MLICLTLIDWSISHILKTLSFIFVNDISSVTASIISMTLLLIKYLSMCYEWFILLIFNHNLVMV
jgi:hypothetical protein